MFFTIVTTSLVFHHHHHHLSSFLMLHHQSSPEAEEGEVAKVKVQLGRGKAVGRVHKAEGCVGGGLRLLV